MDGFAIKALRLKENLTQSQLAKIIGVSPQTIAAVEKGTRAVSDRVRIRCAQFFGVDEEAKEAIRRAKASERL